MPFAKGSKGGELRGFCSRIESGKMYQFFQMTEWRDPIKESLRAFCEETKRGVQSNKELETPYENRATVLKGNRVIGMACHILYNKANRGTMFNDF